MEDIGVGGTLDPASSFLAERSANRTKEAVGAAHYEHRFKTSMSQKDLCTPLPTLTHTSELARTDACPYNPRDAQIRTRMGTDL